MNSKYSFRTDFASERVKDGLKNDVVEIEKVKEKFCEVQIIHVLKEDEIMNSQKGTYISIMYDELSKEEVQQNVSEIVTNQLSSLIEKYELKKKKCLLVGLGNRNVVADALGSEVISKIIVTSHLFKYENVEEDVSDVSAIAPGVMGQTGIETLEIVEGICSNIKPDFVIIIDALATKSMERINKMIQISDVGIAPGSGVGNHRKAINYESLGVPVFAIGVATVVDIVSITREVVENSLHYMDHEFDNSYIDELLDNLPLSNVKNWIVTPREMDSDLIHLSEVIAHAINSSLHPVIRKS